MERRATWFSRQKVAPLAARFIARTLAAICLLAAIPSFAAPDRSTGNRALQEGRVDDAITILNAVVVANPKDGLAHLLLCRAFYSEEVADEAVRECEAAVANGGPPSVQLHDWMGRAYGLKASHSGPLAGYSLAKKVKSEFEAAVAADATNSAAVNDLAEFYIGAPSMVGGGIDKALALADRVQKTLPQAAHRIRGLAAAEMKDYPTAENELKAAAAVAGKPNAWVDLAAFYQKRKRTDDALATLAKAEAADTARDDSLVDMASILLDLKRQYPDGVRLLRLYLASSAKSDAGPACKAHLLIGKLLSKSGDKNGARQEYTIALKLASRYDPARKALDAL